MFLSKEHIRGMSIKDRAFYEGLWIYAPGAVASWLLGDRPIEFAEVAKRK